MDASRPVAFVSQRFEMGYTKLSGRCMSIFSLRLVTARSLSSSICVQVEEFRAEQRPVCMIEQYIDNKKRQKVSVTENWKLREWLQLFNFAKNYIVSIVVI